MWIPKPSLATLLLLSTAATTTLSFVPTTNFNNRAIISQQSAAIASTLRNRNYHQYNKNTHLQLSSTPTDSDKKVKDISEGEDVLDKYGVDFTAKASNGELDPVIGRDDEIRRAIQILSRRTKNNPVLIGDPGVGKY